MFLKHKGEKAEIFYYVDGENTEGLWTGKAWDPTPSPARRLFCGVSDALVLFDDVTGWQKQNKNEQNQDNAKCNALSS